MSSRLQDLADNREPCREPSRRLFVRDLTGRELTLEDALREASGRVCTRPRRLAITNRRDSTIVEVDSIDWIDAAGDCMCVHAGKDTFVLRGTMKQLEELLDMAYFVRVHRSAIVSRQRVRSMRPYRNGEYFLTLDGGHQLKPGRKYKHRLKRFADSI